MREFTQVPPELINPRHEMEEKGKDYSSETRPELSKLIKRFWRGDAHTHTQVSSREGWGYAEGVYSEEEIAKYYQELGLEFVAFAEHTSKPGEPHQITEDDPIATSFMEQINRVAKLNHEEGFTIAALAAAETNILFDENGKPTIDLPEAVSKKLDLVIASRHAVANEKDIHAIKESLLAAINDPNVDIIGHPDRYIQIKQQVTDNGLPCPPEVYWQTWDEIITTMAEQGKAFEINFINPPADELLELAVKKGVKLMINYDAHDFNHYYKQGHIAAGEEIKKKWAQGESSAENQETLHQYKQDRLMSGPGDRAIRRLVDCLQKLESLGVPPERIINSSRENIINFLIQDRGKQTENLSFLKEKLATD